MYPCHRYPFSWSSSYILEVVALRAALLFNTLFGSRSWGVGDDEVLPGPHLLMVEEGREECVWAPRAVILGYLFLIQVKSN